MSRKHGGTSVRMFKKSVALLQSLGPDVVLTHRGKSILEQAKQPYTKGKGTSKTEVILIKKYNRAFKLGLPTATILAELRQRIACRRKLLP